MVQTLRFSKITTATVAERVALHGVVVLESHGKPTRYAVIKLPEPDNAHGLEQLQEAILRVMKQLAQRKQQASKDR